MYGIHSSVGAREARQAIDSFLLITWEGHAEEKLQLLPFPSSLVCPEGICSSVLPACDDACFLHKTALEEKQKLLCRFVSFSQLHWARRFPVLTSSFSRFTPVATQKLALSCSLFWLLLQDFIYSWTVAKWWKSTELYLLLLNIVKIHSCEK